MAAGASMDTPPTGRWLWGVGLSALSSAAGAGGGAAAGGVRGGATRRRRRASALHALCQAGRRTTLHPTSVARCATVLPWHGGCGGGGGREAPVVFTGCANSEYYMTMDGG